MLVLEIGKEIELYSEDVDGDGVAFRRLLVHGLDVEEDALFQFVDLRGGVCQSTHFYLRYVYQLDIFSSTSS